MRLSKPVYSSIIVLVSCAASMSGCTFPSVAASSVSPSEAVDIERIRNAHAGFHVLLADEIRHVETTRIGNTCSSHRYPVSIESALAESLNNVMQASFASHQQYDSPFGPSPQENAFTFEFEVDQFEPRLGYSAGTWTGSALAEASLTISVVAVGPTGDELLRTTVQGDGSSTYSGGCASGAKAVAEAASEAVEEAVQVFVYKVINSPKLDPEGQETDTLAAEIAN